MSTTFLKEFDVEVNQYLTYAQIVQISQAVSQFTNWAERQQNIDILVLFHATNMGKERIESMTHDEMLTSGLLEAVKNNVVNYYQIKDCIDYTDSIQRALSQIAKRLPEITNNLKSLSVKNVDFSKK
jgi:hypothetical protein|nr:MAG TPA: hypothetical protein [Caudoviricetes sp.]